MITNGTDTIQRYKVGSSYFDDIDQALIQLTYERRSTSAVVSIEPVSVNIWET